MGDARACACLGDGRAALDTRARRRPGDGRSTRARDIAAPRSSLVRGDGAARTAPPSGRGNCRHRRPAVLPTHRACYQLPRSRPRARGRRRTGARHALSLVGAQPCRARESSGSRARAARRARPLPSRWRPHLNQPGTEPLSDVTCVPLTEAHSAWQSSARDGDRANSASRELYSLRARVPFDSRSQLRRRVGLDRFVSLASSP